MTIPSWPSSLPSSIEAANYQDSFPSFTITSQTDIGPAKVRRRSTSGPRSFSGTMTLDPEELQTLKSFYEDDLLGGSLRFIWRDPLNPSEDAEVRFKPGSSPSWTLQDGHYVVSMEFEVLP